MKRETIEKGANLIGKITDINRQKGKVSLSDTPELIEHLFYIETLIQDHKGNYKTFRLSFEKNGEITISNISEKGKAVLTHAADTYLKSLQSVFDSEISKLQKEFDNLKD